MKPLKIFVEGRLSRDRREAHSTHSAFIRDCVAKWFGRELNLLLNFQYIGGSSEFKNMAADMRRAEEHHQVLLIIDADGNCAARKKEVEGFQIKEQLRFPFFLFPDNNSSGAIEILIEQCATNKEILKCFTDYEACIGKKLDIEDKIFAYITAVTGNKEEAKEKNRNFLNGSFNLDDACLEPLKKFLSQYV